MGGNNGNIIRKNKNKNVQSNIFKFTIVTGFRYAC